MTALSLCQAHGLLVCKDCGDPSKLPTTAASRLGPVTTEAVRVVASGEHYFTSRPGSTRCVICGVRKMHHRAAPGEKDES